MSWAGHKRRQILVDPDLQVGISMNILGWLFFFVVVFALLANAPSIIQVLTADTSEDAYIEAVYRLRSFTQFTVLPLAVTFVCMAIHGVVFTHRIAGPVYRLKMTLREMARRHFSEHGVNLRKKDYFKDLAAELNTVIDALREDAARERRMNAETVESVRQLIGTVERGGAGNQEMLALAHAVLDRAERLDRHLAAAGSEQPADRPHVPLPAADLSAAAAPAAPTPSATGPAK